MERGAGDVRERRGARRLSAAMPAVALALVLTGPLMMAACAVSDEGPAAVETEVATADLAAVPEQDAAPQLPLPCPAPYPGTDLLERDDHGYCLLFPDEYEVLRPNPDETVLAVGGLMDTENPRAYVRVTGAEGRTADQHADDLLADMAGFDIGRSTVNIGGERAALLENVPAQDMMRVVFVVHADRLFRIDFVPVGADYGPLAERTNELYYTLAESFRFMAEPGAARR